MPEQRRRQDLLCVSSLVDVLLLAFVRKTHPSSSIFLPPSSIFQILFYALRPGFIRSQGKFTRYHALNFALVIAFNAALVTSTGSWWSLVYLIESSFFAGSLHPLAGHFIGESIIAA